MKLELQHNQLSQNYLTLKTSLLYWIQNTDNKKTKRHPELVVQLRLPQPGEYRLALYTKSSTLGIQDRNVCNYLIDVQSVKDVQIFPMLRGPLGPSTLCNELKVKPVSYDNNYYIEATTKEYSIVLEHNAKDRVVCELTSNYYDREFVAQHAVSKYMGDGKSQFTITFIDQGLYGANLFVVKNGSQCLYHVCTYLFKYVQKRQVTKIFPPPTPATVTTCSSDIITTVILRNPSRNLLAELTVIDMNVKEEKAGSIQFKFPGKVGRQEAEIKVCSMAHFATYILTIFEEVTTKGGSIRCLAVYKIIREKGAGEVSLQCLI